MQQTSHKRFLRPVGNALALASVLLGLGACSQLPPYQRPDLAVPAQWAVPPAEATASGRLATALPWRDFVREPLLRDLVQQALEHNHDLRLAVLQIEQARAQYTIQRADQFPTVNAGVTGSRQATGEGQAIKSAYTAGLLVNAWELDLFGRIASLKEAALAQFLSSEATRQAVQTSLVAAVANAWFSLQTSQAQLELARRTLESWEDSLRLTQLRFDHGAASALDLRAAQSLAATARSAVAQQERQRQLDANALALLVGRPASSFSAGALGPDALQSLQPVPVGLPSDVLLQRPDVRAAEFQLVAANARIGAARAAFFPRIALTASLGSASGELGGLFRDGQWGWTMGPQALLPIFDAGRNQAGLATAEAGRELALVQYDKAIQTAFREVNDALAGRLTLVSQLQAQQDLAASEGERSRLSELRLQQGVASQLERLDALRSHFAAQQLVLQTRLAVAQNQVALYKALGGGWSVSD